MSYSDIVKFASDNIKTQNDFYVDLAGLDTPARMHFYVSHIAGEPWYNAAVETFNGNEYTAVRSYSANDLKDFEHIVGVCLISFGENAQIKEEDLFINTIFATGTSIILQTLNEAKMNNELIKIEQCYDGKVEEKTYQFKTGFPHGFRGHSVSAWYSTNFKNDRLYMTSKELANYISAVNSGNGGRGIDYIVTRVKDNALAHGSKKPSLSEQIQSADIRIANITSPNEPPFKTPFVER